MYDRVRDGYTDWTLRGTPWVVVSQMGVRERENGGEGERQRERERERERRGNRQRERNKHRVRDNKEMIINVTQKKCRRDGRRKTCGEKGGGRWGMEEGE